MTNPTPKTNESRQHTCDDSDGSVCWLCEREVEARRLAADDDDTITQELL